MDYPAAVTTGPFTFTPVGPAELTARKADVSLTVEQTGTMLGLKRHPVERLKRTGYLNPTTLDAVERLAARPTVSGGIPVLRLGDPASDDDGRRIGHKREDSDDVLLGASLGWWGGSVDAVHEAGYLALAVSGFIFAVLRIDGFEDWYDEVNERSDGSTYSFRRYLFSGALAARVDDLISPEPRILDPGLEGFSRALLGNRVANPQAAPIILA